VPEPVVGIVRSSCRGGRKEWQTQGPGVEVMELSLARCVPRRQRLRLVRLQPSQETPAHSHRGREITLVLSGGFADTSGEYHAGDILIVADPALSHTPRAGGEGCVCLMLTEAPLRFDMLLQRLGNIFWRF
jgi:putative transcriptional regulator